MPMDHRKVVRGFARAKLMENFNRAILVLTMISTTFSMAACGEEGVIRLQDRATISFDRMVGEVSKSQVIVIGETHDNEAHHNLQLRIIRTLHEGGVPLAVGLEMFRAESQDLLDKWWRWGMPTERFEALYRENWGLPWPLYRDIFLYARQKRIPLLGLNVPREVVSKVAREGYASLTEAERKKLPPGLTCTLDEAYRSFIRRTFVEHAHSSGRTFDHFCEAQMVWDTAMAIYAIDFLSNNPGSRIVILAGSVHAWKRAIPRRIEAMRPDVSMTVILPVQDGKAERDKISADDADYMIIK